MIVLGLKLGTIVIPLFDALKGWLKNKDVAWFLHPVVSFMVAVFYTINTLRDITAIKKIV